MISKSTLLTNSLIDYINDIKPYHTKFRDVTSQLSFVDSFNVSLKESTKFNINFQNVWTKDDIGGYLLTNMSEGAFFSTPTFTGVGNGSLNNIDLIDTHNQETWTVIATSSDVFSVTGSISGLQAPLTVGTLYNNLIVEFMINAGTIPFIIGDKFIFDVTGDQTYSIPAVLFPRFSLSENNQYPIGSDIVTGPGSFEIGTKYIIKSLGNTDFTTIGASSNSVGVSFIAGTPWVSGIDPTSGTTGTADIKSQFHQIGITDQTSVNASIVSAIQSGPNFLINIDLYNEQIYGMDPTSIQITINGTSYPTFTKVGNLLTINSVITGTFPPDITVTYTSTGRYLVPYHQGSKVYVNNVQQTFGTDYIIDGNRNFIQFLPIHLYPSSRGLPASGSIIDLNLFRSDKLFICKQDPFVIGDLFNITVKGSQNILSAGTNSFVIGQNYTILSIGTTDFSLIGAKNPTVGNTFTMTTGVRVGPGTLNNITIGKSYIIESGSIGFGGTTDFTLIGALSNTPGTIFTAVGIGSGNGICTSNYDTSTGTGLVASSTLMDLSIPLSKIKPNTEYRILSSDSIISLLGVSTSILIGDIFLSNTSGTIKSGSFINGVTYKIVSVGDTDFTLIGSSSNENGIIFVASGPGTGTGIASIESSAIVVPTKVCDVVFSNTQPGTHKATLQNASVSNFANIDDVWTISANSNWGFDVQQTNPIDATISKVFFRKQFSNNKLSFIIDRTYANYYVTSTVDYDCYFIEQDLNSYISADILPLGTNVSYDSSEYFSNNNILSTHGNINSIVEHPVRFDPLGKVLRNSSNSEFSFHFDTIPPVYTYIEFKVEQTGQYNPWIVTSIQESAFIKITYQDTMLTSIKNIIGPTFQ